MSRSSDHLDIQEGAPPVGSDRSPESGRPSIQVWFACAGAYQRVFRSVNNAEYLARCPTCGKQVRFVVGAGGTPQRVFEVRC